MGVVKISHTVVNGISLVNFDCFAPASQWLVWVSRRMLALVYPEANLPHHQLFCWSEDS